MVNTMHCGMYLGTNIIDELSAIMVKDGTNMPYMNGLLNLDGYESILSSGLLSYLGQNTQDLIKRLYQRIRLHNEVLLYLRI
jgi:hypothetical protein